MPEERLPKYARLLGENSLFEAMSLVYENDKNYSLRTVGTFDVVIRFKCARFNLEHNFAHELINNVSLWDAINKANAHWNDLVKMFMAIILYPVEPPFVEQLINNRPVWFRNEYDATRADWEDFKARIASEIKIV